MDEKSPIHESNGNTVTLRQYIERILDERDKAVQVGYRNLEQRLDKLNELRGQVEQDRGQFLRLDVFDEKHDALEKTVSELERTVTRVINERLNPIVARIEILESWRLKALGAALILVPLAGLIGAAIMKAFS